MADVPEIRASDAERERVATLLRGHAAEGRLDVDELEDRLQRAYGARTRGDLELLTADLPATTPRAQVPAPAGRGNGFGLRERLGGYAAIMVLLVVIWAATGADYFWPVWPAIGLAFAALSGAKRRVGHGGHRRT